MPFRKGSGGVEKGDLPGLFLEAGKTGLMVKVRYERKADIEDGGSGTSKYWSMLTIRIFYPDISERLDV